MFIDGSVAVLPPEAKDIDEDIEDKEAEGAELETGLLGFVPLTPAVEVALDMA